jgi:hypothetical protein
MYLQREYLRQAVTMPRGQTWRLDLPKTGMLSGMLLKVSADCFGGASLADPRWRLEDWLTKVEIIGNGATIIKSYNWCDIMFLTWLHQGITPPLVWRNYAANTQFAYGLILFGRFLGDPQKGLDLGRWDSVEIRITNTATAAFYGTDLSISILDTWVQDAPGMFSGYIRSEEWRRWTTIVAGVDYEVLPSEFPICTLAMQGVPAVLNGMFITPPRNLAFDIDLSKAGGTKKVYKGGADDLSVLNYLERGAEVITHGQVDKTALRGVDVGLHEIDGWVNGSSSKDGTVSTAVPTMEADDTDGTIQFEGREVDAPIQFWARGRGFMDFVWLLANLQLDPGMNLDPKIDGECRLNITSRNSVGVIAGTERILLERVVS